MSLLLALLGGRRSLVGCTGAELPWLLGMHGSFVRASDVGSRHRANGSRLSKAPSALGASIPTQPLGRGHLLPPGIPAISCSCQHGDRPRAQGHGPPLPAPCSCRQRISMHAASRGTQHCRCQLPARQGEAAAVPAGNLERFPDFSSMSCLYKAICLPRVPSWGPARLWWSWKDSAMGDVPLSLILNPRPACSCLHCSAPYKRTKRWAALCSPDEPGAAEVLVVSAGSAGAA